MATVKSLKSDVLRVSPLSEQLEELWVVCGFICRNWWEYGDEKIGINWLNKKCSLILWGLRVPIWKINFCSSVLRLSALPRCRDRPQTAICCFE